MKRELKEATVKARGVSKLSKVEWAEDVEGWRSAFRAGPCISLLEQSVIEGENPVYDTDSRYFVIRSRRVELFGNAAQKGW